MNSIILQALALLVAIGAFFVGKYVFPNVPKTVTDKLCELAAWADKFVVWAREFKKTSSGADKMEMVVEQLQAVAKEAGWDVTEDQLRAIAQTAYENMMAGAAAAEAEAQAAKPTRYYRIGEREFAEGATLVVNVNGGAALGVSGVAVATDNVPEGALDTNPDGSVNAYNAAGEKVGTVDAAAAEAVAAGVSVIVEQTATVEEYAQTAQDAPESGKDE